MCQLQKPIALIMRRLASPSKRRHDNQPPVPPLSLFLRSHPPVRLSVCFACQEMGVAKTGQAAAAAAKREREREKLVLRLVFF